MKRIILILCFLLSGCCLFQRRDVSETKPPPTILPPAPPSPVAGGVPVQKSKIIPRVASPPLNRPSAISWIWFDDVNPPDQKLNAGDVGFDVETRSNLLTAPWTLLKTVNFTNDPAVTNVWAITNFAYTDKMDFPAKFYRVGVHHR